MKPKQRARLGVDILMTVLLLVMMAYPVTGQLPHEWGGAGMFLLFIAHHVLNRYWFKTLGKGKYNGLRTVQTGVDILLLVTIAALLFSGIRLSRYVFVFLPGLGSAATARKVHMLFSYWSFLLMGLHLGLHWSMVTMTLRRRLNGNAVWTAISRLVGAAAGLYGVYALWKHQIWLYLTLRSEFILFDFDRPAALYFLDYFCMMVLFALLAHMGVSLWQKHKKGAAGV